MHRRNILIPVHDFPPHGGGGVIRILKFVKYLPEFGWNPIVLTLRPEYYRNIDQSLLAEIPDSTRVVRTSSFQSRSKSQKRVLSAYHQSPRAARKLLKLIRGWMYRTIFVKQDEDFLWLPFAWTTARRLLREYEVEVILTTSPPHAVQWLGLVLYRNFKIPWIVDLRDAWVDNPVLRTGFPIRRWIERRIERDVMRNATHIITATPPIAQNLSTIYPNSKQKSSVILNGYDPEDFDGSFTPPSSQNKFVILHAGSISTYFSTVETLFKAVVRIINEKPRFKNDVILSFLGSFGPPEKELAETFGISSIVDAPGWIGHKEAIVRMQQSNVLLVVLSELVGGEDMLTGKVFEYIGAERFILVLAPLNSGVSKLVTEADLGIAVPPTDVDAVSAALKELYRRFLSGNLKPKVDPSFKQQFNRREQTRNLADLLEQVIHGKMQ